MSQFDVWLANYHRGTRQVWCERKECALHREGMVIDTETENGQTTFLTEVCPICHSGWLEDQPGDEEEGM